MSVFTVNAYIFNIFNAFVYYCIYDFVKWKLSRRLLLHCRIATFE